MTDSGVPFPSDIEFQKKLIKVLLVRNFAPSKILPHLEPNLFSTKELRWIISAIKAYYKKYENVPTWDVLLYEARELVKDPAFVLQVENIRNAPIEDAAWVRDNIIAWIRSKMYVKALNASIELAKHKKIDQSLQLMDGVFKDINNVVWEPDSLCDFFCELPEREKERLEDRQQPLGVIPTGVDELDEALNGGIAKGELGVFLGYAKSCKSIFLMNVAANACRYHGANVYHTNYEVNTKTLKLRYDTWFAGESFNTLLKQGLSATTMQRLEELYARIGPLLKIKGQDRFLGKGRSPNYKTVDGIIEELRDLEDRQAWRPDLIIVDYADLMRSSVAYNNVYQKATEIFRSLHDLALDGYAILTVSQANERQIDRTEEHLLRSNQVSESQEKFRAADIYGSINMTDEEQNEGVARILLERTRSHGKGGVIHVSHDLDRMRFAVGMPKPMIKSREPE